MKKIFAAVFLIAQLSAYGQFPDIAKTPPMGWNSWNAFALNINSKIVMAVADSMVSKGLAAAGYQYIVIDDGWQIGRDQNGNIIANPERFPKGIKYVADYVHSRGLKFGIYTCCGTKTCGGYPGSYGYESIDAQTYADWGVDYIKEDWCYTDGLDTQTQYKIMSDAIKATGRKMLLSLCEWGISSPWKWGKGIGSMWRTTSDIQDCFDCVRNWGGMGWAKIIDLNANLAPYAGPGHWNDPDMLEVGNSALTPVECRSHFSMWCMLAAPLIAGNNIATMNDTIRDILTAPELIAIDQDPLGAQGTRLRDDNGLQVWQKPLADGSVAVALLNLTIAPAPMKVSLVEIGFRKGVSSSVRDLWNRKGLEPITDSFSTVVEPHGVVVVKIKGEKAPVSVLSFEQTSLAVQQGNHKVILLNIVPSTTPVTVTSSDPEVASVSLAGVNMYTIAALREGSCSIRAVTNDGNNTASSTINVVPSTIPSPWWFNDINDDRASVMFDDGVFSIEAGGLDIWGTNDRFGFLNRSAHGDSYITARIISQTNSDPWAKSGLMFRATTDANSPFVMVCITPGNGVSLQWRDTVGGTCDKKNIGPAKLPYYFKLTKQGATFTASISADGSEWSSVGDVTVRQNYSGEYRAGLEVASHNSHFMNLSKFDHVTVGAVTKK